jgi:subtilisin family serine protease
VLARTTVATNSVILSIDAAALPGLAADPNVVSINPVVDFEMDLSETVPYIGAGAVQDMGYDGTGVKVAVLDSGIDYTHAALGGSGDPDEYAANDPTIIEPGTFPTAKVVGGYDFTGSQWPFDVEAPDPDPLDDGPEAGHGTHVAHIIGGEGGVAPGVDLYAVKVCSSVSTSCSGIALLQAMDFILDPNGDGNMSDKMDVINMSLGSTMGNPIADDLSYATEMVSQAGVLVVASIGNSSDKMYMAGTPGASPSALGVAQTSVPSAVQALMEVTEPESIAGQYAAVFQPWSVPLEETGRIEGPLMYGDTDGDNLNGCAPYDGDLSGYVVLADRGACNFTLKIKNIGEAGGVAGIIGLIAPGDPFEGGDGGDRPITIPGFMISQANSNKLKGAMGTGDVTVVFDPANGIPLVGHMVGSSSRGPTIGLNQSKPDIGAPGASVSAIAGTGTGTGPFGGTSGAAPMVTGSAALLMQAYPERSWAEIKAVLMNTGETDIMNTPEFFGGDLAAISRIGGGEVRVDKALNSPLAAWDNKNLTGSLSFGFVDVDETADFARKVRITNYSNRDITLRSEVSYRFDNDANGAVRVQAPSWFVVPSHGSTYVTVHMFVRPWPSRPLHPWAMNSGSQGANPAALTFNEYDGYIHFMDVRNPANTIHMPWHVLPRGAANFGTGVQQTGFSWVKNYGKSDGFIDTYSLIGTSPKIDGDFAPGSNAVKVDLRYVGVQTYPVPAGFCSDVDSFVMSFAVNTWDRQQHANPVDFEFELDTNNDGTPDYLVINRDITLNNVTDGRNVTWTIDLATGSAEAFFFTTHFTNSGNTVLTFCGEQIGMNADDFFVTSMGVNAYGFDFYYGGGLDYILGMNVVPLGERYLTIFENGDFVYTELPGNSGKLGFAVLDFGDQLNETETGLLWLYGPGSPADNEAKAWIFSD